MNPKFIISHIRKDSPTQIAYQSNDAHCLGVAELAEKFASEFGMGDFGRIMGLLHDKGKEKKEFQNYILYENELAEKRTYTQDGKAHAYVGGLVARKLYPREFELIGNPIMGHHRGLYDYTDFIDVAALDIPEEVSIPEKSSIAMPIWFTPSKMYARDIHHIERMLYSCLVDADYLDTERFMQPDESLLRGRKASLLELLPRLNAYLTSFGEPKTEVNKIRCQVQQICRNRACDAPGFYSLTVPTGGGKTLSSLVWAVNHAIMHGKKRIIIAIPYTSIIVQTAAILRNIFGAENVLEHHCNVVADDLKDSELTRRFILATENWDYPIIVTTNVQLFESMMASRSSDCRKLHNVANSVLILDEVQTLPTDFLQPIVDSLETYKRLLGLSVLFTTASQPVLEGKHQGTNPSVTFNGLNHIEEIIPKTWNLHNLLRRVELDINDTPRTYDEIAEMLVQHDRVLCIVNTRRDAKEIFDRLPDDGVCIHLSRMMCPAHVSEKIDEMKRALNSTDSKIIRVVSTQLIEAGVDIDFPVVYRQEAGLDSILQAAGRCNREGNQSICTTHVFSLSAEHALPRGFITQCNNARQNMLGEYDWFSSEAMNDYFLQLYSRVDGFDKKDNEHDVMKHHLYNIQEMMFETAARKFKLIDDDTVPVVVNWEDSFSLIEQLKHEGPSYTLMKKLSQYSVNLRRHDFNEMKKSGIVEEIIEGFYVAFGRTQYNKDVGLLTDNKWLEETYII